jgi:type IV pilus assembly protein PilZ
MKLPVVSTAGHQDKCLLIDVEQETIAIQDSSGTFLGSQSWREMIEQILHNGDEARFAHSRTQPRAPLAIKVRYTTPEGKRFDGLTGGVGGGGLFIESSDPLAPGTALSIEFALPDRPWETLNVKAKVAWARKRPERQVLFPGMGVQFVDIDEKAHHQLVELVEALNRSRSAA